MRKQLMIQWSLAMIVAAALVGCSTAPKTADMMEWEAKQAQLQTKENQLSSFESQLQSRQSQLSRQQAELQSQQQQLAQEKARMEQQFRSAQAAAAQPAYQSGGQELLPPNAQAGECYARVFVAPKYKTVTQQVLKNEAGERIEIIPPRYEKVTEQILVKEASQKLEVIPAKYNWVEEQVLVKPASQRMREIPAQYETVTEKILVKPAHTVWKKGTGPIQRIDEATGEIMCLVQVPDQYKTVTKRVLKAPATTQAIEEPAVYKTVKKRVMVKPPTTRSIEIPAEYKTVQTTKLVQPAQEKRIPIPAQYQTVTKQVLDAEGHMEWREILCETNMTGAKITAIQRALQQAGYNPGAIDGVIGSQTMQAVNAFQKDKGLVITNNLTMNTIKALGLSL